MPFLELIVVLEVEALRKELVVTLLGVAHMCIISIKIDLLVGGIIDAKQWTDLI